MQQAVALLAWVAGHALPSFPRTSAPRERQAIICLAAQLSCYLYQLCPEDQAIMANSKNARNVVILQETQLSGVMIG